jgi:hypothetical protein
MAVPFYLFFFFALKSILIISNREKNASIFITLNVKVNCFVEKGKNSNNQCRATVKIATVNMSWVLAFC